MEGGGVGYSLNVFLPLFVIFRKDYHFIIFSLQYDEIAMTKSNAAYLTSVFWGCFLGARFFNVPISTRISAMQLLLLDLSGSCDLRMK